MIFMDKRVEFKPVNPLVEKGKEIIDLAIGELRNLFYCRSTREEFAVISTFLDPFIQKLKKYFLLILKDGDFDGDTGRLNKDIQIRLFMCIDKFKASVVRNRTLLENKDLINSKLDGIYSFFAKITIDDLLNDFDEPEPLYLRGSGAVPDDGVPANESMAKKAGEIDVGGLREQIERAFSEINGSISLIGEKSDKLVGAVLRMIEEIKAEISLKTEETIPLAIYSKWLNNNGITASMHDEMIQLLMSMPEGVGLTVKEISERLRIKITTASTMFSLLMKKLQEKRDTTFEIIKIPKTDLQKQLGYGGRSYMFKSNLN